VGPTSKPAIPRRSSRSRAGGSGRRESTMAQRHRNHSPEPGRAQARPVYPRLRAGRAASYDPIIGRCSAVSQPPAPDTGAWLMRPTGAQIAARRGRRNHLLALPRPGPPAHWSRCPEEGIQGARVHLDGTRGLEHGRCTCYTSVPAAPRAPQLSRVIGLHPIDRKAVSNRRAECVPSARQSGFWGHSRRFSPANGSCHYPIISQ